MIVKVLVTWIVCASDTEVVIVKVLVTGLVNSGLEPVQTVVTGMVYSPALGKYVSVE